MSNYLVKYFNWIGVENEGIKRILKIALLGVFISHLWVFFVMAHRWFQEDFDDIEYIIGGLFFVPLCLIGVSIIIKILNWIIDGFEQGKS